MNTFFIGCTHFGHSKIIQYENRPFSSVEEMDETLIKNWNSFVKKEDIVWMLGDFSLYGKEKTQAILSRLNGHKYLVMGNHDRARSRSWWLEVGFEKVYDKPVIIYEFLILSHQPMYLRYLSPFVNVHAHIHGKKITNGDQYDTDFVNVCVEQSMYFPTTLKNITKYINNKRGLKFEPEFEEVNE